MSRALTIGLIAVAALVIGCSSGSDSGDDSEQAAAAPADATTATATASRAATPPTPAPPTSQPATATATIAVPSLPPPPGRRIVNTGGDGVALRDRCSDDSRVPGAAGRGFRDGDSVREISRGEGECAGWTLARSGDGRESWVRLRYLSALDTSGWSGDITTATWGTILGELGADERACVEAELTPSELEVAASHPLLDTGETPWAAAIGDCMTVERIAEITQAITLTEFTEFGVDPAVDAACYRPFIDEQATRDRGEFFMDDASAESRDLLLEALVLCSGEAIATRMVRDSGLDPASHPTAIECARGQLKRFFELADEDPDEAFLLIGHCLSGGE